MNTPRYYCEEPIIIGGIYKHVSGTEYRVESIGLDATGYEETGEIGEVVKHTQLKAGHYPKGTEWSRDKEDFLGITDIKGRIKRIFEYTGNVDIKGTIPFCVSKYMESKHSTLRNNYRTPDNQYSEACAWIAIELSHLFVSCGKLPEIIVFSKDKGTIKPRIYDNLEWGAHVVCCYEGIVFDPMLDKPIPLLEYSMLAFGEEVAPRTHANKNEIVEFINRGD